MPYAFTEQGIAMLSGVLHSDKAINMNIAIMRAFVQVRQIIYKQNDLKEQLNEIKARLGPRRSSRPPRENGTTAKE